MALVAPELMEPSATPGAQTGLPTGSWEPSLVPADYEDEFLRYLWRDYLYPKQYEWVLIAAYVAVFLVALVGNTLGRSRCPCGSVEFPWGLEGVLGLVSLPSPYLQEPGTWGRDSLMGLRWSWLCPWLYLMLTPPRSVPGSVAEPPHEDSHQLLHRQPVPG